MICCSRFVWVHLPKTGGTWVRETISKHAAPAWNIQVLYPGHHSIRSVEDQYRDVPAFGFIRNPWEWYVSWHAFWGTHFRYGTGAFAQRKELWNDQVKLRAQIAQMNFAEAIEAAQEHEIGLNHHYRRLCLRADGTPIQMGRFEDLRRELLRLLRETCGVVPPKLKVAILTKPAEMKSEHRSWQMYYQDRTIARVAELEREIIDRYGFSFT